MKRNLKSIMGVTLLEIMLVLAIAAMVIVMSIRYYQSATSSQQANSALEQIQSITAAIDSISQGSGGYTASAVNMTNVQPLLPKNGQLTPWNTTITTTPSSVTSYSMTLPSTPAAVCPVLKSKLSTSTHYSVTTSCSASAADFTFTYSSS
jgi:type II secretory pathway pseudopilin PulG